MGRLASVALALLVTGLAASPARAGNRLDDETAEALGGTYAVDCHKPGVRLLVAADTLAVTFGKKQVVSHDVQRAMTYMGTATPADYQGTLLGDVPGGESLVFHVYRDAHGVSLAVDADAKLLAAFGKPALARRFQSCDAPKAVNPKPPAKPAPQPPAGH